MRASVAVGLGLLHAAVCEFIALLVGGAGHGWVTPFFWGSAGFLLFPFCYWAGLAAPRPAARWALVALAFCLVANVAIWRATIVEGVRYFSVMGGFAYFWITVWLLGQAPLVLRLRQTRSAA